MKTKAIAALAAGILALPLTGCATQQAVPAAAPTPAAPAPTVTETYTPQPEPTPTEQTWTFTFKDGTSVEWTRDQAEEKFLDALQEWADLNPSGRTKLDSEERELLLMEGYLACQYVDLGRSEKSINTEVMDRVTDSGVTSKHPVFWAVAMIASYSKAFLCRMGQPEEDGNA